MASVFLRWEYRVASFSVLTRDLAMPGQTPAGVKVMETLAEITELRQEIAQALKRGQPL